MAAVKKMSVEWKVGDVPHAAIVFVSNDFGMGATSKHRAIVGYRLAAVLAAERLFPEARGVGHWVADEVA